MLKWEMKRLRCIWNYRTSSSSHVVGSNIHCKKKKFGALKPEERKKGSDLLSVSLFLHPPNLNCLWLRKHSSMSPLWKHCLMHPPPKQTLASAATIQQKFLPARRTAETLVCLTYSEKKKHSTQEQLCVPQTHPAAATREESIKKKASA